MVSTRAISAPRVALIAPVLAVVLAGCSATGTQNTTTNAVTATTSASTQNALTIYISDPPAVKNNQALQDVVSAEQLAFTDGKGTFRKGGLRLKVLTDQKISDNARDAIADNSAIAYLGELQKGASVDTVGITNANDLLEFSATDTVVPIKDNFESASTYGRTFASLPNDLGTTGAALAQANTGFAANFKAHYNHAPSAQAIQGYVAMQVLLRVLVATKNTADNRQNIVHGVQDTLKANKGSATVANFAIKFK